MVEMRYGPLDCRTNGSRWYYAPPHSTIPVPTWCRQFIHVWPHRPVARTRGRAWIVSVTPRQYTMWNMVYTFHKVLFYRKFSKIKTILSFLVVLVKTFPSWSQPFIYVWFLLFSLQNYHELDSNGLSRNCFKNKDTLGIHFVGEMIIKHFFFLISIFKHFSASLLCFLRASPPACQNPLLLLKFSKSRKTATYRVEPNLLSHFDKFAEQIFFDKLPNQGQTRFKS